MRLDSPEIKQLHERLMKKHNAQYDYDEYKPHLTLSYNYGDGDIKDLPDFKGDITFDEEYQEEFDDQSMKEKMKKASS